MRGAKKYKKIILVVFIQKCLGGSKWATLGAKMVHRYNSGSTIKIVFKFFTVKRARKYVTITLMISNLFGATVSLFGPEMMCPRT